MAGNSVLLSCCDRRMVVRRDAGYREGTHEVRSPHSSLTLFLHFIFARKQYPDRAL